MDKSGSQAEGETDVKYEENVLESEEEEEDFGSDEDDDDSDDDVNDDDDDNSDDDDDDNDDDDDEEDDDDDEIDEGDEAVLEASDSDGTDDTERCPICLNRFKDQDIGTPESCDHMFCLECIQEWSKNVNTCPSDRLVFKLILCKHGVDDVIYKKISVEDKNVMAEEEEANEEPTYCEVCNECNREDRLLLCDGCDLGYHLECLNPPLDTVPVDEWFCPACARREGIVAERDSDYIPGGRQRWRRQIPRTLVMERVRSAIEEIRVRRTRNLTRLISSDEDDDDGEEATSNMDAATPSTSSAPKPSPKKRKTPAKRKIKRRYRKRKTKRKSTTKKKTTKTTPRKTPVKRKTKRKRKAGRKKKRGKRVKRLARTAKPPTVTTVKSRIAGALGISSPPPGCTIPVQKKTDKSTDLRRPDLGCSSFSIFGDKEELNFFEDEHSEAGTSGEQIGATRKYSRLSRSSYLPIGRVPTVAPVKTKKKIIINTTVKTSNKTTKTTDGAAGGGGGVLDLLGSIMQDQTKLAMSSKDVTIQRDGSLITKPASPEKPKKSDNGIDESSPSSLFKSSFQVVDTNLEKAPSILSSLTGGKETTSAPDGDNEEEYDPAHPTDDVNDDTKEVVEDVYDPAHPTDDVSSEDDDPDTGKTDNDENEVETIEPESAPESSVNEFELVKVKDEPGVVNDEICQDSIVENVIEKSKDVVDELPTSINDEKSSIETVVKIEKNEEETVPETEEFIERDQLIERIEKNKEDKAKSKVNKESVEKFKLSGKFKPISSDNVESSGSTKLSVSDRFKMIEKSSKSPESANFDDEDPIHEMRKLDKELDLEFGNAEFAKKKDKNKEVRKNKRKVSLDESEGDGLRYKREVKEIHEKKKGDSSDYKYGYEEKEEGEVDEEYRLKDKKKKDKKKRKSEKHFENEEKDDSEIDRRIVIQVSQNTEDRTVWEEAERQRRKRDREEKRKDKLRDLDGKRDKKLKRLRSRSRSHERRRSRSKDRKRSRSHDRSRDKGRKKRRERSRSRSRSREWSHEKSRKKKKRDKKYSRDVEKDLGREWSRERSREREWSWENDWSSERGRDHHRSRGDSRDRGRDRKRSRDRSDDKVDMFGRSRSPFTRKSFVKDKHIVTQKPKVKPFRSDEVIEILDSSPPKKQKYDEVSSSESEKMSPERDQEEVQKISTIEVKNSGPRETNIIDNDEKDDEFDDEPEETEQFQYTDREEFTGQNKSKQMSQNLITLGVGNSEYDPANPTDTASPAAPPLPDSLHAPTPPLPPTGDFAQFPPPPPGPPPQGPPPGSVIIQDRASLRVPPGGPVSGPGILGEAPLLLQGPPPIEAGPPPSLMQQGPALSLPVNVLPPGFHRGLPPTIAPQRQVIVSPLRPAPPRVQGLPGANVTRFGWQVTTSSEGISSQFGTIIPSHARLPGPPIVNGPYDGLPPPSEPPLRPSAPGEPQLIHIGPDPRAPPPRLPIPLLPPSSDPLPISAMVSIPPPNSAMLSMPPPDISKCVSQSFNRPGTPPDSVSAILGLARMGANAVSGSTTLIPGLTAVSTMNVINGNHDKGSVNSNGEVRKMMGTSSKIEKSGENLQKSSNKQNSSGTLGSSDSKDVFKVPDIPATKGGKTDVETTEVIDMDMGSPIIEEGNIELPVSPQFDNLIDNPEDLLEEDFNKKMQKLIDKDMKKEASTGKDKNKDKSATPTKNKDIKDLKDSETKTDSPVKSKDDKSKRSKENKPQKSGHRSRRHHHKKHGEADKDLKQKALKDAHIDLDSQDLPSSAVDLTNKEKYLQKLHLQERVVEEVKMAIKPFYSSKKINKDQYKEILRKAVPKICHSKSGNINPMKIKSLVEAYVEKFTKRSKVSPKLDEQSPGVKANGERGKVKTVR